MGAKIPLMGERQGQPLPLEGPSWFLNAALSVFIFWLLFHFHPTLLFLVCIVHRLQGQQVDKDCSPRPPCLLSLVEILDLGWWAAKRGGKMMKVVGTGFCFGTILPHGPCDSPS